MKKEKNSIKQPNVFDFVNQINLKTSELKFNEKQCPPYMLVLHYSHDNSLLEIVNNINKHLYNINSKYVYDYFYNKIPKKKRFTKWVKKDKKDNINVTELMEKYNISEREAMEYL